MFFVESTFSTALTQYQLPFQQVCEQLSIALEESEQNQTPIAISRDTQGLLSINLRRLLPNFFCYNTVPIAYQVSVTSLNMMQWIASLAYFEPNICRDKLLKDTATIIKGMEPHQLSVPAISCILYNLRMFSVSKETKAILRALIEHLSVHKPDPWLKPDELSDAIYGLQKMHDCREVKKILKQLQFHFVVNKEWERWLNPYEISKILYGLKNLPSSIVVKKILVDLISPLVANAKESRWLNPRDISMALYGLHNMKYCPEVKTILTAIGLHLNANTYYKNWLTPCEISDICYGLKNLYTSAEVQGLLSILQAHLDDNTDLGCGLAPQQIHDMLRPLYSLQQWFDTKVAQTRLTYHLNLSPDAIDLI
jgi:hypothetical protein